MEYIDKIYYRMINPSDFKKLYDIDRPATGGGQTYLEAAGISYNTLTDFLSKGEMSDTPRENENRNIYTINAYVLGRTDGLSKQLEFDPRSGRNNYKISRQTIREKHPAWSVENGFPEPPRDETGQYQQINNFVGIIDHLTILIFRTTYNRYFASYVNSQDIPTTWPQDIGLEVIFQGERRGVLDILAYQIPFINNLDNPFGQPEGPLPQRATGGRNVLLYGVPGAGKSHTIAQEYCRDESLMERLVFHSDYTYSDFVGQILPNVDNGLVSYEFTEGPFTRLLKKAYSNPNVHYFLVIEEINRGNAPAIFGEVFQLLDRIEDGTSEYGISNTNIARIVHGVEDHKVRIPSNMSIIATMNTSDQNVFTLDTAFQRRWNMHMIENDMREVDADFSNQKILDTDITWKQFNESINDIILENNVRITSSEDKRLGAYFIRKSDLIYNPKEIDGTESEKLKATQDNRRFPEKVIKYLWDDAFKFSRDDVFDTVTYKSLEDIIRKFRSSRGNARFNIFKEGVIQTPEAFPIEDEGQQ
ncbi:MAG: AAA family ATPase [Bacillota bacterium]|nr:AAA family ATPase [Bacillota bacterium]MDW7670943.1 AAA family ATPase [Bacillota bacterium]